MKKVSIGESSGGFNAASTIYGFVTGVANSSMTTNENTRRIRVPSACKVTRFYVAVSSAPGAGKSWTFKIRRNSADGAMSGTISDSGTSVDITSPFDYFSENDYIDFSMTPSGTPTLPASIFWFIEFESAKSFPIYGFVSLAASNSVESYCSPLGVGIVWETNLNNARVLLPIDCVINKLRVIVN